jgi:hypothetical protein
VVWAAWEPFERGYMLWRWDTDKVYVFYKQDGTNRSAGTWKLWDEPWPGGDEDCVDAPVPPGKYEPVRGFCWLWREFLGGPNGPLGWATGEEKGFCVKVQRFETGRLLQSNTVEFCLDSKFNWARHPDFEPLFFALYGDGTWQRVPIRP